MSENNEHSPDDTETETGTREDPPNDSSKSEAKLMMNQMDAALLEDEEMPTYISVSSTTRPDDSDIVKQSENQSQEMEETRSPSPYASDDQAASSVYVLSSEEDETDQHPYNDEDDEDEYADSDDMENLELDNEFNSERPSNMKHLMDDEDDDDEDDEDDEDDDDSPRQMHNYDDGIDDNYETDCYDLDGRSDDFILNRRLKNRDKEKSLSLQDLNMYKNNMKAEYFKRRHSQGLRPNYPNIPEHAVMYSTSQRKQPMPGKYHYVQSKVKRYIKDIKDQNRRSMEKHIKQHQEDTIYDNSNTDDKNNDTEKTKPTVTNKTIKDYAERTIKELEIAETCDSSVDKVSYNTLATPIILNGQDNKNCLESIQEESIQNEVKTNVPFESTQNERDFLNTDNKMQKQNGTIEVKQLKLNYSNREIPQEFGGVVQPSLIQNGHQEVPTVLYNLRTLSYEEYMHGTPVSSQKINLNRNTHVEQEHVQPEGYNNTDLMEISTDNDEDTCPLKIENIKSIETMSDEVKNNEQITFSKTNEEFNKTTLDTSEVITLRKKLTQKTVEYNNLLETYQKQLMENLKMKQDLDKLRKTLTKYEKENKPREQKIASVQTDIIDSAPDQHQHRDKKEPTTVKQSNNKISGNSVASTLSSIDQWSSSACNLSISMKPPEVTKTLHSDDSMVLIDGTPGKTTRSLSREFITSSRIIQTLSNLTQGKTKPESLIQNSKKRSSENEEMDIQNDDSSYQYQPSSSKKRKIVDFLRPSNFLQPFNTAESHPKLNETPKTESQFKNLCDSIIKNVDLQANSSNTNVESPFKILCDTLVKNVDLQANTSNTNANQLGAATSTMESKMETTDDPEDNVKCFVYREDESSKERSFLILAEVPENNKTINDKGRLRECGPYLIGNVEVRMSEVNGTLHIWGQELSEESTTENETEASARNHWQKTPHTRFNGSNIVCSTSKKSKGPPKFELSSAASNFSCLHSPSFNVARASCSTNNAHTDKYSPDVCASSVPCEDCDLSKHRKEWLKYKRMHPQEKLHSCSIHSIDTSEQKCNCSLRKEKQKFEDNFNCSKEKLSTQEHRRSFSRNLEPNKHLHENIASEDSEHICRNCTACNHSLHNPDNFQENHKCCNMLRETYEPLTMNIDREHNQSRNHSSHHVHEEEPLITLKQCSETPETRRRRLTGKRVRGMLMDLIRGCGDCYNPNVSSNSKSCMHKKEPYLRSCSPQIKITPCASPEPSCSNPGQPGRCCHAYVQRIESQLEEFRMEMERMRSRSDAILDMLNMLHSVDTN
ncbi:kinesin-related protein 4 [Monomorium pharaonis]|uniref:kinesin-related protein 4 n=1 Tax=Monomorium pharaonis TaxID=307658 RepID=UPI00063F3D6A|nr:kinesin-related protein 4 [Monomorium pharaonis]XP_012532400.1 kinesin-related protein 4 [Monomorium pharaonis]